MSNFIEGTVQHVSPVQQITESFRKRTLIILTTGQYPEYVSVEATQDRVSQFDGLHIGQYVKAFYNVRGSKEMRTDKNNQPVAYTGLSFWKFDQSQHATTPQQGYAQPSTAGNWADQQHAQQQAQLNQGYNAGPNQGPPAYQPAQTAQGYPQQTNVPPTAPQGPPAAGPAPGTIPPTQPGF